MRIGAARQIAAAWVRSADLGPLPVLGAFFTGSTVDADPDEELAPESDVDVAVVVDGEAPAKLGKLERDGVRIEVTFLPWSLLADPGTVARTFYLAPSFARDSRISDPTGRLASLQAHVSAVFARPDVVRDRWASVVQRMVAPPAPVAGWPEAVTGWLFPASLSTNVVLVAACRNPTVRLRYVRAREVLAGCGLGRRYPELLEQLGCAEVTPAQVRGQLPALTAAYDDAAAAGATGFAFRSDITPAARPVAIAGTEALVRRGDHREAVFWLVATFARSLQILTATASPTTDRHASAFAAAVAELTGLRTPADLAARRAAVLAALPRLEGTAEEVLAATGARG